MKKSAYILLSLLTLSIASYAQDLSGSPDLLKDKSNFSKTELFDPESVFADIQVNMKVVEDYEKNPASYKNEELLPVAISYMTLRNPEKTKELLQKFMMARPENLRAMRTYATLLLLSGSKDEAFGYYEKAAAKGDRESIKSIASAYILTGAIEGMSKYLKELKEISKTDLSTANMLLIYAYRDEENRDLALAKDVIEGIDVAAAMATANQDAYATALNLYLTNTSVWTPMSLLIPARGAILGGHWGIARQAYDDVLAADPKNSAALRGKAVVEYNLGGVMEAANLIMKSIKGGDKSAVNDAMELSIVSKNQKIYDMFKPYFENAEFNTQIRLNMLAHSINNDDQADIFFKSLSGKGSEILLEAKQLREVILKGLSKYEGDMRSFDLKKRLDEVKSK